MISHVANNLYQNITFLLSILLSLPVAVSNRGPNREGMKILQHLLLEHPGDVRDLRYSYIYMNILVYSHFHITSKYFL